MFYRSVPKGAWFLGWVFILTGVFLLYVIQTGMLEGDGTITSEQLHKEMYEHGEPSVEITPDEPVVYWWRYLMIFFMVFIGTLFLINVDSETVEIHKEHKLLILGKMNPWLCCRRKTTVRDLELLTDVGLVKRGHDATQNNTIYYAIEFRYGEMSEKRMAARREEIMEFTDLRTAKLKYVEVMTFIDRNPDLANVRVTDESTSRRKPTPR